MQFCEITLNCMKDIEAIRNCYGHVLSSHSFTSLFLWQKQMKLSVYIGSEVFLVKYGDEYFFPCGSEDGKKLILEGLSDAVFHYASEDDVGFCERYFPGKYEFFPCENDFEYIYDKSEQIEMSGKRFTYQRAKVNKARRLGDCNAVVITDELIDTARQITSEWAENRDSSDSADVDETMLALSEYKRLKMFGILLFIDRKPVGFNIGTFITGDTFDLHIGKTIYDNVDALMKLELYKCLPDNIKYINREEDLGIKGLRMHKTDAQPCSKNQIFTVNALKNNIN